MTMRRHWHWSDLLGLVAILVVLARACPGLALTPRDELLRLVPEDVGFCLVVQDLRQHAQEVLTSPFSEQFRAAPLGQALKQVPEIQKLGEVEEQLYGQLNINWIQLRDDIFGDAVVLAYRPGPPDKPEEEQGLLLLRARNPALLANLLDRINYLQKKSGELHDILPRKYKDVKYFCRVVRGRTQFYYLHGPVLAFATQEAILQQVMDHERPDASPTESYLAGQLRRLDADKSLLALWLNPRTFEPDLVQKAARAQGAEAAVLKTLVTYWKALDGIALSVSVERSALTLQLTVQGRKDQLSPGAQHLFAGEIHPSSLWNQIPEDALLGVAGRIDAVALTELLCEFLTPDARETLVQTINRRAGAVLGKDVLTEVLPSLGPDWGLCVIAPPPADKTWFPHVLAALRIQPGDRQPSVDQTLLAGLNTLAMLGVFAYNADHPDPISLKTVTQGKVEIRFFAGDKLFPNGVQPAYAFKDGYLVLATSPEDIRRFVPAPLSSSPPPEEILLARSSLRALAEYLNDPHGLLALQVARKNGLPLEEARRRLQDLAANLQLFNRLELSERSTPGRLALVLRLTTVQPVRK